MNLLKKLCKQCKCWKSMQSRVATVYKYKYKMINFDGITVANQIKHNPK